jgi:poly(hydroxyalkanoate) depolymerase family esterase
MDLYVPDSLGASPGIVVALHYCTGNAGGTHGWFQSLADQYGFVMISPDVGPSKECWDAAPTRSGERAAIVQMVEFVIDQEGADPQRVFAAGASSGACMTNAMMAAYPDVFSGGSVLAGIPAGAWTSGNSCCGQNLNQSAEAWGDIVRNAFPSFTGVRPRLQLFHGTSDPTLNYSNLAEEEKQWSNVLGVTSADAVTEGSQPKNGWERTSYTDASGDVVLEVVIGQGKPHDLTPENLWSDVVRFFGLDQDAPDEPDGSGGVAGTGGGAVAAGGAGAVPAGGGAPGAGGLPGAGGSPSMGDSGGTNAGGLANVGGGTTHSPAVGGSTSPGTGGLPSGDPVDSPAAEDADEGGGCQLGSGPRPAGTLFAWLALGLGVLVRRRLRAR